MHSENEAASAAVRGAAPSRPMVQSLPFYLTDRALRDGARNTDWTLNDPDGQTYGARVFFPAPFGSIPAVAAGITQINGESNDGGDWTVKMTVVDVQKDHFDVVVAKDGDIQVHFVNAVWVAWVVA